MELILWRHADAEYSAPSDLARRLTPKGHLQAEKMANWLHEQLQGRTVRLIASGATRAQETLAAFRRDFTVDPRLNCGASAEDYLAVCRWPGAADEVVILVGHQPDISEAANLLLHGKAKEAGFDKGAICWLQGDATSCVLRTVMTPEML